MTKLVADAYTWIEYLEESEKGSKAAKFLEDDSNEIFTSSANVAEVISKFLRSNKDVGIAIKCINSMSNVVNVTQEIANLAGQIHFEAKKKNKNFGMFDAFVAATAKKINAKILTGDIDFKNFKEAIMI